MAAQSYIHRDDCHGWMGVRFQPCPGDEPSEIIIHVRMLDRENLQQQEAIGVMGVNLIYGALNLHHTPDGFIKSLMDDLTPDRVEVDMIKFSGPAFQMVDNRLASLQLVQHGLTNAAMFTAAGEVVQASEVLYKKSILVERGSFRPVTKVTLDMLNCAQAQFVQEPGVQGEEVVVLMEMTLKNLIDEGAIDYLDFLERVDILGTLGKPVLISNYGEYHRLASYLFRHTKKKSASRWACRACAKFSTRILRRPGGRHPRILRTPLQKRSQALRLSAPGRRHRLDHHRRQPARRAPPAPPLRLPAGKPFHPEPARLQRRAAPHLLPANPDQNPERRSGLGK